MAQRPDPLALDDPQMTDQNRNAAIWFAQDGFDPKAKGINGRRVAGESFLRGFFRHAQVDEWVSIGHNKRELDIFNGLAAEHGAGRPTRQVLLRRPRGLGAVGVINYPSPIFTPEIWRRAPYGQAAWSICGITHTTSTKAVMQGIYDLRMAPVADWDALICTSQSVLSSVNYQMDLVEDHLRRQFNATLPARPQLPVIPLGVHVDEFTHDAAARAALRARLGMAEGDVVLATIARLSPHEKFDPLPLYLALQAAQGQMPAGKKLHLLLCGITNAGYARGVFEQGATRLMPDVGFHLLDGANAMERKSTLSAADIFLFTIDNIQETFGLAPIEGMSAGLPLIVSDWDGMKDTVTPDVGFRITTRTLRAQHTAAEAVNYMGGSDTYPQYCAAVSAMTQIDVPELTKRVVQLARDPDLRRRMGAAARARAQSHYSWAAVIPQMQDLWADLNARRPKEDQAAPYPVAALPVAPSPFGLFAGYPTQQVSFPKTRFAAVPLGPRPSVAETLRLRNYAALRHIFETPAQIVKVHALIAAGSAQDRDTLAAQTNLKPINLDRILIWLLKYDFIRPEAAG